jgi:hypothetical protein
MMRVLMGQKEEKPFCLSVDQTDYGITTGTTAGG